MREGERRDIEDVLILTIEAELYLLFILLPFLSVEMRLNEFTVFI